MKKTAVIIVAALLAALPFKASAQQQAGYFDHVSAGVTLGILDGVGVNAAASLGSLFQVRAGYQQLFGAKYEDMKIEQMEFDNGNKYDIDLGAKLNVGNASLLFDYFPSGAGFHVTAGAYIGSSKFVQVYTTKPVPMDPSDYNAVYYKAGDEKIYTDKDGNVEAGVKVSAFKPYLGIGFGRAASASKKLAVTFDIGAAYWGDPWLYVNDGKGRDVKVTSEMLKKDDNTYYDEGKIDEYSSTWWLNFMPVVKLSIFYKLF